MSPAWMSVAVDWLMDMARARRHDRSDINCLQWDGRVREVNGACPECQDYGYAQKRADEARGNR